MMSVQPDVNADARLLSERVVEAMRLYEEVCEQPILNEYVLDLMEPRRQGLCDALAEAERGTLVH